MTFIFPPQLHTTPGYSDEITGWTVQVSNPGEEKKVFSSPKRPNRLWGPPSLLFNSYRCSFPGIKRLEHEAEHSPSSISEVYNEWSITSAVTIGMPSWFGQGQLYIFITTT